VYNHAPDDYACPFCLLARGIDASQSAHVLSRNADTVYRDGEVTALIASHQWPNNHGHVLLLPNAHHENIYELPLYLATRIHELARALALAMKAAYGCDGTSTRQHNEPAGNQDVWHYHLHLFPRYAGDALYTSQRALMPAGERAVYAARLRAQLGDWAPTTRR
jgi:histidine triad (HIT) family protein